MDSPHNEAQTEQLVRRCFLNLLLCCGVIALLSARTAKASYRLVSPDGQVRVSFELTSMAGFSGCPVYGVAYRGRDVIADARLGLTIADVGPLDHNLVIVEASTASSDATWSPVYGQWKTVGDRYSQLAVTLRQDESRQREFRLVFRAYDEGVAFRYETSGQSSQSSFTILSERSEFRFLDDHTAHAVYSAQGIYSRVPLSKVKNHCERPLTVEIEGGPAVAVGEAGLVDYARMRLSPAAGRALTLVSSLASDVTDQAPFATPWRVVLIGDSPGQLLERSYLMLNLNEPCAISDPSWIRPGKVIREVTLTTTGGKACVDFAVEHNLQYVEYDAGWYGHEYDDEADARTVSVDPKRSPGPLDLPAVIEYAKQRGIGILLYVNRRALERQLDEILPLYRSWGIKGVKYGFVQVGSQRWTAWLHEAVRKAAAHRLMVDVHDEYRPTGYSRTYPNLMTQEGIRGNECMPTAEENLVLPFTRMLCGAGDYTICYYNNRIKTTHAHQLAASVVYYSPWQFLFWYDRPSAYQGEPEIEFFRHVPTVWDDLKVIDGRIGEYVTIARRSDEQWFVGVMNGLDARRLDVALDFLDRDKAYVAHIYYDAGESAGTRTGVGIDRFIVHSATVMDARLRPSGGQAMRLTPAQPQDVRRYPAYSP